jgi:magnesium transporter
MQNEAELKQEREGTDQVLDSDRIRSALDAIAASDATRLSEVLEPLHAADVADLLEQISTPDRDALVQLWGRPTGSPSSRR